MRLIITALLSLICVVSTWAKPASGKKGNAQWAFVRNDGAMVYSEPDAESNVIAYLNAGDRVAVSRLAIGEFYKIRLDDKKVGYISSNDVSPIKSGLDGEENLDSKHSKKKKFKNPHFDNDREKDISDARFVGGFVSVHQMQEDFAGATRSDRQVFFGIKLSEPEMVTFSPFLTDVNFGFSFAPPGYYTTGADSASGYALWLDLAMLWPLSESRNFTWYIGAGPMLGYVSYKVLASRKVTEYENFRLGVDVLTGFGYRIDKVMVRFDVKYFIERNLYPAVTVSVQHQF